MLTASLLSACGEPTPDYQALLANPPSTAAPTTTTTTENRMPISAYLESVGVVGDTVAPEKLTDLTVTMPRPEGWQDYTNTNLAPGTRVIAEGDTYPMAMLLVFRLEGKQFDVAEALKHADVDAEVSENFTKLNGSKDDFGGFPSSMIEGSYDLNGQRMQTYNRIVLPTGPEPAKQRYLVQLTITSFADEAQEQGPDIEAIISGFTVAAN